jgi:hypothetical protein
MLLQIAGGIVAGAALVVGAWLDEVRPWSR